MSIIAVHTYKDGRQVGFDDVAGQWVPFDPQAAQGSFLGNVMRSAGRSAEQIGQGAEQLFGTESEADVLQRQFTQQQQEAASRSAPYATGIGSVVPDVAAGLALAPLTGGASLPAIMGMEAGLGAVLGGIRPGSFEERLANAGIGAAGGAAGVAGVTVAVKGIGLGFRAADRITGRSAARANTVVDSALARVEASQASQAAAEPPPVPASAAAGRGVGAVETPAEQFDPAFSAQEQAVRMTETAGQEIVDDATWAKIKTVAQEQGMQEPLGAGTRKGSAARMAQAVLETVPGGDLYDNAIKANNQRLVGNKLAKILDMPGWKGGKSSIFGDDIENAQAALGSQFEDIARRLPDIDSEDFIKAMRGIDQSYGYFGKLRGQQMVEKAVENAQKGKPLTGSEFMQQMQLVSGETADAFARGDVGTAEVLQKVSRKLYDLVDELLEKRGSKPLTDRWKKVRQKYQVLLATKASGAISKEGDVNTASLLNKLGRDTSKGGFGRGGSALDPASDEGQLFKMLQFAAQVETGVPMTGVRAAMKMAAPVTRPLVGGALAGGGILGGMNLFGH